MSPAFSSFAAFLNMGGYAVYVWLAVAVAAAAREHDKEAADASAS